jgi:hypothetical protein
MHSHSCHAWSLTTLGDVSGGLVCRQETAGKTECWRDIGEKLGYTVGKTECWRDIGEKLGYKVPRAQDRHTSVKTSNRTHRTLLSSDKSSGGKGSLYALFLAWSPTNIRYTRRLNTVTQLYSANYTYAI